MDLTKLVTAIAQARSPEKARRRLEHFLARVKKSVENADAAFAAVQASRELAVIDTHEAMYLFFEIYDCWEERYEDADPVSQQLKQRLSRAIDNARSTADADAASDRFMRASTRRSLRLKADYHRARGEELIADMMISEPERYAALWTEGEARLVSSRVGDDDCSPPDFSRAAAARISERVLAVTAAETLRDEIRETGSLWKAVQEGNVSSAVVALQELRELGLLTPAQANVLLDEVIAEATDRELERDHEYCRLSSAFDALGPQYSTTLPTELIDPTFEMRVLSFLIEKRCDAIHAIQLRGFGEHRLANLLLRDRNAYYEALEQTHLSGA
jgi:hypothetical protein